MATEIKKGFIPMHEDDLKYATEVPVKNIEDNELIKIEKAGEKGTKIGKLKKRKIDEEIEEIEDNKSKENYTLIITEKPQAAEKIASALGKPKKHTENKVSYYELKKDNKQIVIAAAVGHLLTLTTKEKKWPVFDIKWEAEFKRNKWAKKYYQILKKLAKNASEVIIATDYDIEGEVIGWNIIRFIAKKKDAKRMKFSTLTKTELEESFENPEPTINWGQAIAGETRHFLDWMYGINLSRALMSAIKSAGRFKIMSIGRIQGPALRLIVEKEREIQKFKPEPFWQVFIKLKFHKPELKFWRSIKKKTELGKFKNLKGEKGNAKTEKKKRKIHPPYPFDLTSLQREAYRFYKITPAQTLQIAQNLYLAGVISYPRTSSQKIPDSIQPKKILEKLKKRFKETSFIARQKPIEGKKTDPAHPSIYPTGEFKKLSEQESKIYNLIAKRFISCFCSDAEVENKKITFITDKDKLKFKATGLEIIKKGWLNVYPAIIQEQEIEDIEGKKEIEKTKIEEKETKPPKRYTPASIITELEKRNLGTKATRANIIETLYSRNYIEGQSIKATPLGMNLIETLEKNSPIIIDEKLTRHFEKEMEAIQKAKKNQTNLQDITIKEAKKTITKISNDFKKQEEKIGKELVKATEENWKKEQEESIFGECPACKKGKLRILYAKQYKRYFIGCTNYPKCRNTYTLPPNGTIKKTDKTCEECGFPMLMRLNKGKKPWVFCFNPKCASRKQKRKTEN